MPLIFQLLLLITGFGGFNGVRDETMCTLNACYTVYMEKVSFDKANQRCFHNGGYLMTLRNKEEEEILHSLLLLIQKNNSQQFWIGLKLHRGDCVLADKPLRGFKWVSGEADSQYSNWNKDPVDTCTERCVRVSYNSPDEDQLTWTAGACKGPLFSVCKFYFKGMCSALHLLGSGYISYMAPFSEDPLESEMKSLPLGTYAKVSCTDQQEHFSVCIQKNEIYQWTVPGPFCQPENVKCAQNNGGCEHICQQDSDQVKCICNQGYDLEDNGLSCKIQDVCTSDTCEYECIVGELEHICICPIGFELDANLHNCSDIDECQESDACSTHFCINTAGSYMCACREGFRMNQGNCHDLDECVHSKCSQSCLNTIGSFSCCCEKGFTLSEDGYSCEDINECATVRCPLKCINTEGSFICGCPEGFHVHSTGTKCTPDVTDARGYESVGQETPGNITETVPMTTGEPQTISTPKDMPVPLTPSNTSLYASAKVVNSRVLICVLGSVIPLLLLVTVTLTIAVVRCRRLRKEAKKSATDSYCWVSSGFNPRLEKLYESILTDDL
ncbi:complement component C1q receptor-like [Syngnathoides biaculeatus]|uniref:complement component C1q receptor-like n=1 Tax=Syngnathoides biaculeatus TaxID=300417 RepID=UPI002ADD33DA|nr:complement component C1q receptor-like [Syngnathoides biaculeatus]